MTVHRPRVVSHRVELSRRQHHHYSAYLCLAFSQVLRTSATPACGCSLLLGFLMPWFSAEACSSQQTLWRCRVELVFHPCTS